MKIVIPEKIELTKDQIEELEDIGDLIAYDNFPTKKQMLERVKNADIVVLDWSASLLNPLLDKLKKLKLISCLYTGIDDLNVEKAKSLGIKITNIQDYSTESVSEFVFGLILTLIRKINISDNEVRNGEWVQRMGNELEGKTLGIVGLGRIGTRVAEIAKTFKMKVIAYTRTPKNIKNVKMVSLEELLKRSDIITLHCNLNPETENLISKKEFNMMKSNCLLIDCARGKIIKEKDLIQALKNKKIAGVGLDVFTNEPIEKNNSLLKFNNVVLTPHIAWNTKEAYERKIQIGIENIKAFTEGKSKNMVW